MTRAQDRFVHHRPRFSTRRKGSQDLFAAEVRRVVNTPDFPAADFVRRLLSLDLALQES